MAGENVLSESERIENGNALAGQVSKNSKFDFAKFTINVQDAWKANVEVFKVAFSKKKYDLVISDETFELWMGMNKDREMVKVPVLEIGDYLGIEPISWNPKERIFAYINNRIWCKCASEAAANEIGIFIGEIDDVPDKKFGFLLPNKKELARKGQNFVGYVVNFDLEKVSDQEAMKKALGYEGSSLIVCSIGGSSVGKGMLDLCNQAFPLIKKSKPNARMVLVCGPAVEVKTVKVNEGVEAKGFLPNLPEYYAASDLSIITGGGTSTVELTALRRPFIFLPLEGHHEQQHTVASRCARYHAGIRMNFSATPESLAAAALSVMGKPVDYGIIPVDGANNIAAIVSKQLSSNA